MQILMKLLECYAVNTDLILFILFGLNWIWIISSEDIYLWKTKRQLVISLEIKNNKIYVPKPGSNIWLKMTLFEIKLQKDFFFRKKVRHSPNSTVTNKGNIDLDLLDKDRI